MLTNEDLKKIAKVFDRALQKIRKLIRQESDYHSGEFFEIQEQLERLEAKIDRLSELLVGERSRTRPKKTLIH